MGLPPTSSKISTDAHEVTTFKFDFPNFTGTHTGTDLSLGVNSIAGGGTGNGSLPVTAGGILYTDGSIVQNVGAGTSGEVLQSNGASSPTWVPNVASGPGFYNYNGYYAGSLLFYWQENSSILSPFIPTGTPILTQLTNNNFGTVSNEVNNYAGISFTAPRTGVIKFIVTSSIDSNVGAQVEYELLETTTTTTIALMGSYIATGDPRLIVLVGYFSATASTAYNIDLYGAVNGASGTQTIGNLAFDSPVLNFCMDYIS